MSTLALFWYTKEALAGPPVALIYRKGSILVISGQSSLLASLEDSVN